VTRTIALVTCAELPDGDEDAALIEKNLREAGIESSWEVWTDPQVDWARFDLAVVRATWDYTLDRDAFLAWAAGVPRLANPPDVLRWNTDKTYLRDAAAAGVPVVPTEWIEPGEAVELPGGEFVVKPSVGAGSKGAGRFHADEHDAARAHAGALHDAGRTVMVQPYLADVDASGETALVYLDGTLSHAIGKAAMLPRGTAFELVETMSRTLYVPERITPRVPDPAEVRLGDQVRDLIRARFGGDLLYARIDILPTPAGPVLIELELAEPGLFLGYDDGAGERFAAAVASRLG
jgi:glutathione synthase/RimK-type ligase-like ATP-grasp enzyme